MGQPKLLLPWGDATVIEATIEAWFSSLVDEVLVVVHPDDDVLAELALSAGAEVIVAPEPPPDMKASIQLGLDVIRSNHSPADEDGWLVAPADMPGLSPLVIDRLLAERFQRPDEILIPTHQAAPGHPALFPWPMAAEVARIPAGEGLKWLLARHPATTIECGPAALAADLDTPDDYHRQGGPSSF
jgi:molybdenum cofactor cytidylyltransferase